MDLSLLAHIVPLVLAVLPGLHYDRWRRGDLARIRRSTVTAQYARVVISSTLVTAATLTVLELLRQLGPGSLLSLGQVTGDGALPVASPGVMTWSVACFLMISLTLASLAAAVLLRLEDGSGPWRRARPPDGRDRWRRLELGDLDVELEVKLSGGDTYRGLYGNRAVDREQGVHYITLNGPIFEVDGHGKPLPLDALHWDHMVVPTRSITSVLIRPADRPEMPTRPSVTTPVPGDMRPRHSMPRVTFTGQARAGVRRFYENRFDPRLLAKLLATQIVSIGLVGLLTEMVA
ncbi:hypothetical protein GCM10010191_17270 [Actinomadura vinacea]|uniref:Uncharacterized protein n=1 Tax=Actinomadura vinacea TaxID=115336 RepID=A0ABN3IP74_9ACTN